MLFQLLRQYGDSNNANDGNNNNVNNITM